MFCNRAEDQVEIKMPPAYADIFAASGTPGINFVPTLNVNKNYFSEAEDTGSMGSPPAYYSNSPSPQESAGQPPQVESLTMLQGRQASRLSIQVVVQVATPPQTGPVKKTYRKVKKTPVVPTPKPEDL